MWKKHWIDNENYFVNQLRHTKSIGKPVLIVFKFQFALIMQVFSFIAERWLDGSNDVSTEFYSVGKWKWCD